MAVKWVTSSGSWQQPWPTSWTITWLKWKGEKLILVCSLIKSQEYCSISFRSFYCAMFSGTEKMGPRVSLSVSSVRVVPSGTQNSFNMPVMLSFWGKEENKAAVTDLMARRGFKLNTGGSGPTGTKKKGCGGRSTV